jgi:hypothetical protein
MYNNNGFKWNMSKNNFWIYCVGKQIYDDFVNSNDMKIGFNDQINIKKDDTIILVLKDPTGGFIGVLQIDSNITNNKSKFKHQVKLKSKKLFIDKVRIKDALDSMKLNISHLKNPAVFGSKYLKMNSIVNIDEHGQTLANKLLEIGKQLPIAIVPPKPSFMDLMAIALNNVNRRTIYNIKKKIEFSSEDDYAINKESESQQKSDTFENARSREDIASDNSPKSSMSSDAVSGKSKSDKESYYSNTGSDSSSDDIEDDPNGYIPIIIVPCKEFKLPLKNRETYFVQHYKSCNNCDITNNNNRELCSVMDEAEIEFLEIVTEKHGYFDPALDHYFGGKKFEPMGSSKYPFIRAMYINNAHDIYNKCIFITWCDLQKS